MVLFHTLRPWQTLTFLLPTIAVYWHLIILFNHHILPLNHTAVVCYQELQLRVDVAGAAGKTGADNTEPDMVCRDNRHTLLRFKRCQSPSKSPNLCPPLRHPLSLSPSPLFCNNASRPHRPPPSLSAPPPSHHLPYPPPLSLGDGLGSRPVGVESPICGLILLRRRAVNTHFCGCQFGEGGQQCGTRREEPAALPAVWEMLVGSFSAAGASLSQLPPPLPNSGSSIVLCPTYWYSGYVFGFAF